MQGELREKKLKTLNLYEFAPPEGLTGRVHFQSWGRIFDLTIRDEHLGVTPICSLDYPWDAYSFTVANWSLVEELWPNPHREQEETGEGLPRALPVPASNSEEVPALVTRQDWLNVYLAAPGRRDELSASYRGITAASIAINLLMAKDPTIEGGAYKPRVIERRLENIFPPQPRRQR
jgi:hypothetical protein